MEETLKQQLALLGISDVKLNHKIQPGYADVRVDIFIPSISTAIIMHPVTRSERNILSSASVFLLEADEQNIKDGRMLKYIQLIESEKSL